MLRDYISLARPDHWFRTCSWSPASCWPDSCGQPLLPLLPLIGLGLVSACLIASSGYTINEWLDAAGSSAS
jgi:4-hydroxybenzoate polyprenyltransferase